MLFYTARKILAYRNFVEGGALGILK